MNTNSKKIFLFVLLSILVSSSIPAQDATSYKMKRFFHVFNLFSELKLDPAKLDAKDRKIIKTKKRREFRNGQLSVRFYTISILDDSIGAGVVSVLKSGKPFSFSARIGIWDVKENRCDSVLVKKVINAGIDLSFLQNDGIPCFYTVEKLDGTERKNLLNIVGDSLINDFTYYYISYEPLWEILDSNFDFYNPKKATQFNDPYLKPMQSLFKSGNFTAMKKMLFTQNRIFNWFVAEALVYYHQQSNFLNKEELKQVNEFNGRNGYAKFRRLDTLEQLYKQE